MDNQFDTREMRRGVRITPKGVWVIERWHALLATGMNSDEAFDQAATEVENLSGHEKAQNERRYYHQDS